MGPPFTLGSNNIEEGDDRSSYQYFSSALVQLFSFILALLLLDERGMSYHTTTRSPRQLMYWVREVYP